MKKIYIPFFALSLLIGIDNAQAQQPSRKGLDKIKEKSSRDKSSSLRMTSVKKLPQKAQLFNWDNTEEVWNENGHAEYTYDTRGNILKEVKFTSQGDSAEISLNSYNTRGQQTEHVKKYYNSFNDEWVNSFKETISYDAQGNQTENMSYYWANNQWEVSWGYKSQATYDIQNRLIESIDLEYNDDDEIWENNWKMTYGYSGNAQEPNIITEYEYDGYSWAKTGEYTNIVWRYFGNTSEDMEFKSLDYTRYDEDAEIKGRMSIEVNGNTTVHLEEIYLEGEWTWSYRNTIVVQTDGSTVTTRELFEDDNWIYTERDTEYTDSKGEDGGYKYEEYSSGEWTVNYFNRITNTYNDNDEKIETVREYTSQNNPGYKEKQVFSDFITIDQVTGIASSSTFASLSLYPNPATDAILLENIPAGAALSIANIGNQQVLNTALPESSARISVASLQPGIYFATIRSASGEVKTLKFIKQ